MQRLLKLVMITLLTAASATLSAAPVGYSINADSSTSEPDSLYTIDLFNGQVIKEIGIVRLEPLPDGRRMDVEGLAFAPDGSLYGIDDETLSLFRINPVNALIDSDRNYRIIPGALTPQFNDFGMTFACDGTLFVTSVTKQSLYRIDLTGTNTATSTLIGNIGKKIGALAAFGNPTKLYGLSNGTDGDGADPTGPYLYEIDTGNGQIKSSGKLQGSFDAAFTQAGLSFSEDGRLWAITDRSPGKSSQVLRIDAGTTTAVEVHTTTEQGFESLAISPPAGCNTFDPDEVATFVAQKQFSDGNNITPVTFNFECSSGTVVNSSKTIFPKENGFGPYLVSFSVGNIPDGVATECEIEEVSPPGYTPKYECQSETSCSTNEGNGPCKFQSVRIGQAGYCMVNNQVDPVELTVTKQWEFAESESIIEDTAEIFLFCSDVVDGDGEFVGSLMRWNWAFVGNPDSHVATLYPDFNGDTQCWTEELLNTSAIESESTCSKPVSIPLGDTMPNCVVTNTVFYEGIPTLNPIGLALISALMLLTGLISFRRIV